MNASTDYSLDYSALERGWATEGAARWCKMHGHATHVVDGVDTGRCPRCLELTEKPAEIPETHVERDNVRVGVHMALGRVGELFPMKLVHKLALADFLVAAVRQYGHDEAARLASEKVWRHALLALEGGEIPAATYRTLEASRRINAAALAVALRDALDEARKLDVIGRVEVISTTHGPECAVCWEATYHAAEVSLARELEATRNVRSHEATVKPKEA